MKKINILILTLAFISTGFLAKAGGYKISFTIPQIKDTIAYFGYYFADKKFAHDTLHFNSKGVATISGKKPLDGGIYMLIFPSMKNKYFEILIDKDQTFSLSTDTTDFLKNMKVKGSDELTQFYDYQHKMIAFHDRADKLNKEYYANKKDTAKAAAIRKKLADLTDEVQNYWKSIATKDPNSLLGKLTKAMIEVKVPDDLKAPEYIANKDSALKVVRYVWAKDHFFDNIDLSDPRLLRTPIYYQKLNYFITKVVVQRPDSVIKEANRLIKLASGNKETYRYMVAYMLGYYERTHIMGMDKVFVNIAENYYLSGKADWADSTFLAKIRERVVKIEPNLIGNKAPDLIRMTKQDSSGFTSLYQTDANYIILVFWSPDCGHCKKAMPVIKDIYDTYKKDGVKVFAVSTLVERKDWDKFILDKDLFDFINVYDPYNFSNFRNFYDIYSTPVIYLLDKDKKIIAKRIDAEQLGELLEQKINPKKYKEDMKKKEKEKEKEKEKNKDNKK